MLATATQAPSRGWVAEPLSLPIHKVRPLLGSMRVVDVRDPDEFHGPLGHLPGAESVPLPQLEGQAEAWHRGEPVALVCRAGARSLEAARRLQGMGFHHVLHLGGGMLALRGRSA